MPDAVRRFAGSALFWPVAALVVLLVVDVVAIPNFFALRVQDRVLGVGVNSSSLFTEVPGYATAGIRFGVKAGRHQVTVHAENLNDKNYRGISWGVDAPERGISARYSLTF